MAIHLNLALDYWVGDGVLKWPNKLAGKFKLRSSAREVTGVVTTHHQPKSAEQTYSRVQAQDRLPNNMRAIDLSCN